jgi:glycosyltransferase involved in cell wall biosynthesis
MKRVLLVPSLRLGGWKSMDRYANALAQHLPQVLGSEWEVSTLEAPAYPRWSRFAARWILYPSQVKWDRFDVVHVLDQSYAHLLHRRGSCGRVIVTVHDLLGLESPAGPQTLRQRAVRRVNQWVGDGLLQADDCLCDSRATRRLLIAHYPLLAARTRVQPLGVDPHYFLDNPPAARRAGRRLAGLAPDARVILHVGSCVPRKNVESLLEAVGWLACDRRVRLLQVGGEFTRDQRARISQLSIGDRIEQHPDVPEAQMPLFYAAGDVLAVPSRLEGFGLPVLEAFAAGVPVVASNESSLADFPPELLCRVTASDPAILALALQGVLEDPAASVLRVCAARVWALRQSWRHVARAVAAAYEC